MKMTVKRLAPRNPFAVAARARHAGVHRRDGLSRRQGDRDLRRELQHLSRSP